MSIPFIFKSIEIRNFLSFGNSPQVIDLNNQGTVTITGENLDRGGNNGAGKTTVINAVCYALYNKPFDNISLQRLINNTNASKNTMMEVRLFFQKGDHEYEVYRARGEEYRIEIRRDGEDITPGKGVTECDALILDIIGVSYDLFTRTVIFSGSAQPFLVLPLFQQRTLIEELFNITILSEKATLLRERIKQTESDIKVQEAVCKQQEGAVELHKKHLRDAQARIDKWEKTRKDEIHSIQQTLTMIGGIDFEREKMLHARRAELKQEGAYLAAKIAPLRKDHQTLERDVNKLLEEHEHLTNAKCPYCSQAFADASVKLVKVDGDIETKGARLIQIDSELSSLKTAESIQRASLSDVEAAIQYQDLDALLEARENSQSLSKKISDLQESVNPHVEAFERLSAEGTVSIDYQRVDALRRRLDHQQFLLKLLTDKNSFIRRRIISQSIPTLNSRLNYYTRALGLPHIVKFDTDMSCTVAEFGRELDFGNLSAGEKKRVNVSMALAFRDVLHQKFAKINLMLIDELDGGALDYPGIDAIVRILKEKSRDENISVFVISHHPSIAGRLDSNMLIRMEHGFSTVVVE